VLKNSYTLNNNVFSLFLNVVRVVSSDLNFIRKTVPHTRSIDGKTTISWFVRVCGTAKKTGTNGWKMTSGVY